MYPQSNYVHLLANPRDKKRFQAAQESMRPRMARAPVQADVIGEMIELWEKLEPIRATLTNDKAKGDDPLTMPEALDFLIEHWETT